MFQNPQQSMVSFYYAGKLLIQFLLFVLFLIFFGLPSYHRYHQKGVLVKTEKTSMQGLELPAVTICPRCPTKNIPHVQHIIWLFSQGSRCLRLEGWKSGINLLGRAKASMCGVLCRQYRGFQHLKKSNPTKLQVHR